jgi:carboxynorspermidine decarboxylase
VKPRYIIDLDRLAATAKIAKGNADALGVHLLMALKSFPLPAAFPAIAPYVEGVTASGLYEARLGALAGREVHVHAPAYSECEIDDICKVCRHIVFNSISQLERLGPRAKAQGAALWLRVNPGFSSADCLKYDPCCPDSRFGVMKCELEAADPKTLAMVEGVHIHALCEGYADDFAGMVERFTSEFGDFLKGIKYVNLGGGEVVDSPAFATPRAIASVAALKKCGDFEVFIEPSEYMVRESGYLEAHVLDVIRREKKDIAVLDVSMSCHATDILLFDMHPRIEHVERKGELFGEDGKGDARVTILGAVSCLAGDVIGEYRFERPLEVGDTVLFGGLGSYSFAQLSWFNGIRHPDIVVRSASGGERVVRSWDYDDYAREFA